MFQALSPVSVYETIGFTAFPKIFNESNACFLCLYRPHHEKGVHVFHGKWKANGAGGLARPASENFIVEHLIPDRQGFQGMLSGVGILIMLEILSTLPHMRLISGYKQSGLHDVCVFHGRQPRLTLLQL